MHVDVARNDRCSLGPTTWYTRSSCAMSEVGHSRRFRRICSMSAIRPISDLQFGVAHTEIGVIQAPEPGPRIMRYELTDFEWTAIRPFLPNMPARRAEGQRPTRPHWRRLKSHSPEVSDCLTINVRLLNIRAMFWSLARPKNAQLGCACRLGTVWMI
jgi:hypothetical protein